ncbi:hypothetical protein PO878_19505 [Iamia majanohamensis]|uniref:Uncharacterized protein n=1 Tax=Iamia majanohamensis TaxID=467976 RepID=A0AAF0BVE3_9ACTN|nr:hypothetical protein [Iamia majanohamensis]WCO66685.1 hypothetical protein PO878_19505 [Iamia majanohamensis]
MSSRPLITTTTMRPRHGTADTGGTTATTQDVGGTAAQREH